MDHDHPYKELFSQPELVADLLRLTDLSAGLDLATLDRRNGSYVSDDWRERESDIIWRVRCGTGEVYVYLLIEFQSSADPDMAARVMTYIGLLWQDLRRSKALPEGALLPPVLPLVLYNGEAPWTVPRAVEDALAAVPPALVPFQPRCAFLLLDEVRMQLRDEHERNLAAAVFRMERTGSPFDHLTIARLVSAWLRSSGKERIITAFQRWWMRTLSAKHSLPTTLNPFAEDPMLTTRIEQWTAQVEARGEARGKAEGKIEMILEMVSDGLLPTSVAELRVRHLQEQGVIDERMLNEALQRLGG